MTTISGDKLLLQVKVLSERKREIQGSGPRDQNEACIDECQAGYFQVAVEEMKKGTSDCGGDLGGCEGKDNIVAFHQKTQQRVPFNLSTKAN